MTKATGKKASVRETQAAAEKARAARAAEQEKARADKAAVRVFVSTESGADIYVKRGAAVIEALDAHVSLATLAEHISEGLAAAGKPQARPYSKGALSQYGTGYRSVVDAFIPVNENAVLVGRAFTAVSGLSADILREIVSASGEEAEVEQRVETFNRLLDEAYAAKAAEAAAAKAAREETKRAADGAKSPKVERPEDLFTGREMSAAIVVYVLGVAAHQVDSYTPAQLKKVAVALKGLDAAISATRAPAQAPEEYVVVAEVLELESA